VSEAPLKVWLEREGGLLRLRLARPKANIVDAQMIAVLSKAFQEYEKNDSVLAALLDHEGPHFSFGASVEEHLAPHYAGMLSSLHALLGAMLDWPRPILVAVSGQCLGGGLELAMAGGMIFVSPGAQLGQPEIKLGVYAPAASALLTARVGQVRAEDLLYSGRSIDAQTALAWGLASQVAEDPAAAALEYFDKHLAGRSGASLGYAVRAAREPFAARAKERLAAVEKLYASLMDTHDANEGLKAFLEKRQPKWEHR
jgi:cyclohexa-1,5-dienecarbonyl-CoA hydratase